jgi:hypothetical protein
VNPGNWDIGQWIVIGLSVFLIAWYIIVANHNRKRGILIYRWLRDGLEKIGRISDMQWIGSSGSGGKIVLNSAEFPFERVEAIFLLESREILPLWLFNLLRNKRDELILKASLRKTPSQEIEVSLTGDRQFSKLLILDNKPPFNLIPAPEGFQIASRGKQHPESLQVLREYLIKEGEATKSLSLQKKAPHLVLRISLSGLKNTPAENYFSSLQNWLQHI